MPGERLADPVYRPVSNNVKGIAEVAFWLHYIQSGYTAALLSLLHALIRTEEQVVFAAQVDHPQRNLSQVVTCFGSAIVCIVSQCRPLVQYIRERFR